MKFLKGHYHITISDVSVEGVTAAAKLIKGKVTEIDLLVNADTVKDRMITKHQSDPEDLNPMFNDVSILKEAGYEVDRFKFEANIDLYEYTNAKGEIHGFKIDGINATNYFEIHVYVPIAFKRVAVRGFVYSKNPKRDGYFYNARAKTEKELEEVIKGYNHLINKLYYDKLTWETHAELVIFDSHDEHDKEWAEQDMTKDTREVKDEEVILTLTERELALAKGIPYALPVKDGVYIYEDADKSSILLRIVDTESDNPKALNLVDLKPVCLVDLILKGFRIANTLKVIK